MAIITASGVSFEFANGHVLFRSLSFSLDGLTALVGPNGVGKTTLARLITGALEPSSGSIWRNAPVTFLPQREEPPDISVAELLAPDYSWSSLGEKLLDGIGLELPCSALSGGQWMRVRLTRALGEQFLILDEPTNDLDRAGREAVLNFLRYRKGGALLISHDRELLGLCENFLELSNQGLAKFSGGWEAYLKARDRERAQLFRHLEAAERKRDAAESERAEKLARQEKRNRRGAAAGAKGGIPKIILGGLKRRAQVTTGKLEVETLAEANQAAREAKEALGELKLEPVMYADIVGQEIPARKLVAEARDFNIRLGRWLYADLTFSWRGNIRLALKGGNGSGKSTLLKAVLGAEFESRGELKRGVLNTLYVDQRCGQLEEEKSVYDNVRACSSFTESEIRNGLAKFLFAKEAAFRAASDLSGGERLRAALAKGFLTTEKPELLVLDEPTNNLDLKNIEFLESFVKEFKGALILVSHDEHFLKNCGVEEEFAIEPGS